MKAIYLHVPFCDSICAYCDFCRIITNEDTKRKWMAQIIEEIKQKNIHEVDTLYFGGGTPSSLTCDQFKKIASLFNVSKEFTVECNPESLDLEKIQLYKKLGVNRISLGVQTFNDRLLKVINRKHRKEDIFQVIQLLKENGINNISIDLMYALPEQSLKDVKKDLEIFLDLDIKHLSIYSLQIEENSIFGRQNLKPVDEDIEADMYELICRTMEKAGYLHYEISSFCKPGYHSKHNLAYWQDEDFIGLGCGASGKENNVRYDNTRSLKTYIESGANPYIYEETQKDKAFNAIMMALRTTFGLDIQKWNQRYDQDFLKKYQSILDKYHDVLKLENGILYPSREAMKILNTILVDFLLID